jgi:DNA-binding MarR family transcriptional regulator
MESAGSGSIPIGRHLKLAQRATQDALDRRLRQHGASVWSWVLLREAANASGASQRELADLMRIEPSTLVRHLDKLAEEGLVERRPDPDDRRVTRVVVTTAGRRKLSLLHEVVLELDAELRGILTSREVSVLERALPRIHSYFTEQEHASAAKDAHKEVPRARAL